MSLIFNNIYSTIYIFNNIYLMNLNEFKIKKIFIFRNLFLKISSFIYTEINFSNLFIVNFFYFYNFYFYNFCFSHKNLKALIYHWIFGLFNGEFEKKYNGILCVYTIYHHKCNFRRILFIIIVLVFSTNFSPFSYFSLVFNEFKQFKNNPVLERSKVNWSDQFNSLQYLLHYYFICGSILIWFICHLLWQYMLWL